MNLKLRDVMQQLLVAITSTSTQKEQMRMTSIAKTDNEGLADLQDKVLSRAVKIEKSTGAEQIILENEWTEFLKNLVIMVTNIT
jgi:hypothetical protein